MSTVGATKSVSIDFDSVLADTMIAWTMEYNRLKHTNITKNEITYWDIGMILPLSAEEISKIFNYVWQHWQEIPPSEPGQSEIIKRIHRRGYRISILTKRERSTAAYVALIIMIFILMILFFYMTIRPNRILFRYSKDDAPSNLVDITSPKIGILFNQPWNKDFNWPLLSEAEQVIS